jgi:acid phosphatase type 7
MLLAAGDVTWCPDMYKKKGRPSATKTAAIIREQINSATVQVRVLALGDLAYDKGQTEELKCFADDWSGFEDKLIAVPGNHEYYSLEEKDGRPVKEGRGTYATPFFEHFKNYAFVRRCDEKKSTGEKLSEDECATRWYKKGYIASNFPGPDGPWRLIALNDNFQWPPHKADKATADQYKKEMDEQARWLRDQLDKAKGHDQRCVLAFWHNPLFSSGQHGHHNYSTDPNAKLETGSSMKAAFGMLHAHGASVVLAGHDHNYEQFAPHDAKGRATGDGIRSFVVGTGGAGLTADSYERRRWAPNSDRGPFGRRRGNRGVLKIDLYKEGYAWEFLQIGKESDKKDMPRSPSFVDCNQRRTPTTP